MKDFTYKTLYKAHLGVIDEKLLSQVQILEPDPFYKNIAEVTLTKNPMIYYQWDRKPFTTTFRSGSPRQRLDETFFAFVLRLVSFIKGISYLDTFRKPGTREIMLVWGLILRKVMLCSLALLYNVEWTPETIIQYLEPAILKLVQQGNASALRELMTQLGISFSGNEVYPAERFFENLSRLPIQLFGSCYWRFLHWMAEAVAFRGEKSNFYKKEWLDLLKGPLYRTLGCVICETHFLNLLKEFEKDLDIEKNVPQTVFKMHNGTNAFRREISRYVQEPDYTENEYQLDAEFMRQALSA